MADEGDNEQPLHLRVVSDNPNALAHQLVAWAKDEVERSLAHFVATLLRTMAGSNTEARYLMHRLSDFFDSLQQFQKEAARGLTVAEFGGGSATLIDVVNFPGEMSSANCFFAVSCSR